jgi:4-hydroxybenzoate polyprenyltransferase
VVIIDVMMIGAGFVIRVLAGAAIIPVSPSHWLVLCTILLSVFLGFTKRRAELTLLQDKAVEHRKVLTSYSAIFLDQMVSVVTAATLMCYILYTVDPRTVETVAGGSRGLVLTVPLVMYAIFRYLYLVYRLEEGGSPTKALVEDRMMIVSIVLWAVLCAVVIYFPQYFKGWFSPEGLNG